LCAQLHANNEALEKSIKEKTDLKIRLEKLEAQFASSDILLRQINPKRTEHFPATGIPGISNGLTPPGVQTGTNPRTPDFPDTGVKSGAPVPPISNENTPQKIESVSNITPQKDCPKITAEKTINTTTPRNNDGEIPLRNNGENPRAADGFEEVSLSNQYEIDNSLKPTVGKLVIPVNKEPRGGWLLGWSNMIWDVVTGRV